MAIPWHMLVLSAMNLTKAWSVYSTISLAHWEKLAADPFATCSNVIGLG